MCWGSEWVMVCVCARDDAVGFGKKGRAKRVTRTLRYTQQQLRGAQCVQRTSAVRGTRGFRGAAECYLPQLARLVASTSQERRSRTVNGKR